MKILLHICCAPCSIYPIDVLKNAQHTVMGFFYRHNIHPFTECLRREETLKTYADAIGLKMIWQSDYAVEAFLRNVAFREADRCRYCYHDRLTATAHLAKRGKFDAFTTTLLYSRFQKHDLIREIGHAAGKAVGVSFFYQDFRKGWEIGIAESRRMEMYRQPYCGCIYSEKERYCRPSRNAPASSAIVRKEAGHSRP
ncbi:epoxyqueuosine reductase QueH [Desulfosarcina sp. OttesenSCG-928-A07]|nr:epoxyqueuosine reductase QueH [Desulfosarcina sp. OttesenSCG-928-G17]MDL2329620.1 epoxyqueuosine reductase QueH [Desulfosarcina sp. OttesenSCG-928-A07]